MLNFEIRQAVNPQFLSFNLTNKFETTGRENDINNFSQSQLESSINLTLDYENIIFNSTNGNLPLDFNFYDGSTFTDIYNGANVFTLQDILTNSNGYVNSFYRVEIYDTYYSATQKLLNTLYFSTFLNKRDKINTFITTPAINQGLFDNIKNIDLIYIPKYFLNMQTGSSVNIYLKGYFFNAAKGITTNFKSNSGSTGLENETYCSLQLDLVNYNYSYSNLTFNEIINASAYTANKQIVNNMVLSQPLPNGDTIFIISGTTAGGYATYSNTANANGLIINPVNGISTGDTIGITVNTGNTGNVNLPVVNFTYQPVGTCQLRVNAGYLNGVGTASGTTINIGYSTNGDVTFSGSTNVAFVIPPNTASASTIINFVINPGNSPTPNLTPVTTKVNSITSAIANSGTDTYSYVTTGVNCYQTQIGTCTITPNSNSSVCAFAITTSVDLVFAFPLFFDIIITANPNGLTGTPISRSTMFTNAAQFTQVPVIKKITGSETVTIQFANSVAVDVNGVVIHLSGLSGNQITI